MLKIFTNTKYRKIMKTIEDEKSTEMTPEKTPVKKVNKTWEAIQKHKGIWSYTNPKWVKLKNELINGTE